MGDGESTGRMLSRRSVLAGGVAGLAGLGLGLSADVSPPPPMPLAGQSNVSVEQVYSRARDRVVNLVTMYPKDVAREGLPVCLMLHGRFGDARKSAGGLPTWLSESVGAGRIPPFAFLAVDGGGNSYWHRWPGDDPMWMLLDEVPGWLAERGLGGENGEPFAAAGISMGGFGALLYARRRREQRNPLSATAVVSPALITSWPEMSKRRAFASEAEWAAIDPLHHLDALGDIPLGVWCGTEDRFIEGTRRFISAARPEYASTTSGGHNSRYYRKALPEVVDFVGARLATP
ncbi:alpha/beta hydrolase [Saccharopolyspora phatthalungensis]|uniref:Acyl-CoA:diacylglycerol acyltransferase n=1 Tax=Saccharopolyspora phatthalungensis TaxID=664693 RepID=A0A840PYL1_9PSEU|nr:alpha/beta hydrolase-fold protein [Saccharopolyspora phatthalungensis]MBB5153064.1 S-formylglutathione hydrolase FrmB [Saccharopolyspora phatthalungensis]